MMRKFALLATAAATLSACGGGGVNSAGTLTPPTASGPLTLGTPAPAPTPTQAPGSGHTFVAPKEERTYAAIGGTHALSYGVIQRQGEDLVQGPAYYESNATTAAKSGLTVAYNPRDAVFTLQIGESFVGDPNNRYQDPVHRTAFGGTRQPQPGVPDLRSEGMQYMEAIGAATGDPGEIGFATDRLTFFYQKPGTTTQYVTLGGYLRNALVIGEENQFAAPSTGTSTGTIKLRKSYNYKFERSVFAYGERTSNGDVPRTGAGTYNGSMLATMVFNDRRDVESGAPTYFQWIEGTSQVRVDFGASTVALDLNGRTFAPNVSDGTNGIYTIRDGAMFTANGTARIDLAKGGFLGDIQRAWFVNPDGRRYDVTIGGSSVDGAFFGPKAEEVGGGFRIVGGRPDERIDILGAFIGKK